uniref:Major facilitator superfamily (MFS) profile domain-containing protein n=1 Tax=Romanomermis culicivorax TaxID=13658 RepID=A0A915HP08_ROMCU
MEQQMNEMVTHTVHLPNLATVTMTNVKCRLTEKQEQSYEGNLPWSQYQIDYILSALGWGRLAAVFPGGYLADRYSSSKILQISMIIASISTILTPMVAIFWGYTATYALRVILGLTMGVFQPCITALIAQWSPEEELSSRLIFVMSGLQLTVFILNPILAQYCTWKAIWGGWPIGFFSGGVLGFLWCIVWHFYGTNFPEQHKKITKPELEHIMENRKFKMEEKSEQISLKSYPFRSAFFSKASIACLVSDVAGTFGVYSVLYYFPRYLRDVVVLDLKTNGFLAGLPNLLQFIFKLVFSFLAEFLKKSVHIDKTTVVKAFNAFGLCSLAILLFSVTFVDCQHQALAVLCVVVSKAMYAATGPGYIASELLIAPKYAGTMCGFFNFTASLGQIALPYLMANVVLDSHDVRQWRVVFGIGSCLQVSAAVVFLFWGSGEEQEWSKSTTPPQQLSTASTTSEEVVADKADFIIVVVKWKFHKIRRNGIIQKLA